MKTRTEELGDQLMLHLEGELNIEQSEELKNVLLEAINQPKAVVVNLEKAVEVSLSTLQLLCAAHRSALLRSRNFSLSAQTEVFRDTMRMTGYRRHQGCKYDRNNSCLWLEDD